MELNEFMYQLHELYGLSPFTFSVSNATFLNVFCDSLDVVILIASYSLSTPLLTCETIEDCGLTRNRRVKQSS